MSGNDLRWPLQTIHEIFNEKQKFASDGTLRSEWGERQIFEEIFEKNIELYQKIPYLTRTNYKNGLLSPNSLVRYVGMIQDIFDLEFYAGIYEEVETATGCRSLSTCKYTDCVPSKPGFEFDFDGINSKTLDRLPLYCTPIPGISEWANISEKNTNFPDEGSNVNRQIASSSKRVHADTNPQIDVSEHKTAMQESTECIQETAWAAEDALPSKKVQLENQHNRDKTSRLEVGAETEKLHCLVKVYDSATEGVFKLNDTVEFVGVLAMDPLPALSRTATGEGSEFPFFAIDSEFHAEFAARSPPFSAVPRLHCISYRKVGPQWPLEISNPDPLAVLVKSPHTYKGAIVQLRASIINYLQPAFKGDRLAAEYCLLGLLAKVHTRLEDITLGAFSVNFNNMDSSDIPFIQERLASLHSKIQVVKLTVAILNSGALLPKKDYERNRLCACSLQLSEGTVLLLDETEMDEGQLNPLGLKSLEALQTLITVQQLPYDFQFYQMQYNTDHPVLIFSKNKALLKHTYQIAMNANPIEEPMRDAIDQEKLHRWRYFLAGAKALGQNFSISEEISNIAEAHFVEARRQNPQRIQAADFHRWLTLSRLVSLSFGDQTLTREHWDHALNLECSRLSRVSPFSLSLSNTNGESNEHMFDGSDNSPSSVMTDNIL